MEMTDQSYLRTTDLCRHYRRGPQTVRALDGVSIDVNRGEFLSVVGSSGSGKSTLLNLMAGLDSPTSGEVMLEGESLHGMTRRDRAGYRAERAGMIFQSFNLVSHYSALQNVEAALLFGSTPRRERRRKAGEILERLGLGDRITHRPADLSGGEQQRVAVARAIVKDPEILFADEPTGNLDLENARQIADLLKELNAKGLTIIIVTHNPDLAREYAHRSIRMQYGKVVTP